MSSSASSGTLRSEVWELKICTSVPAGMLLLLTHSFVTSHIVRVCSTWDQALAEEGGWVRGGERGWRGGGGGRTGGVGGRGKERKKTSTQCRFSDPFSLASPTKLDQNIRNQWSMTSPASEFTDTGNTKWTITRVIREERKLSVEEVIRCSSQSIKKPRGINGNYPIVKHRVSGPINEMGRAGVSKTGTDSFHCSCISRLRLPNLETLSTTFTKPWNLVDYVYQQAL